MAGLNDLIGEADDAPQVPDSGHAAGGLSNKELMAAARTALSGNWGMAVLGYILCVALMLSLYLFVASSVFFVGVVSGMTGTNISAAMESIQVVTQLAALLFSGAFAVGFASFFLAIVQEGEARLECLFTGFKRFWTAFGAYFFSTLFILLWMLLLYIPGIIAAFRYAMVYYVLADDATCGPLEAITRSKQMMMGNKWKLFCLNWRFLGWVILCMFTGGIGFIWLIPYMQTSFAEFYEDVK